jgi:hypothetical protein
MSSTPHDKSVKSPESFFGLRKVDEQERKAPGLPDDQHAGAARDKFPDDGRCGQFPGDEQPA